MNRFVDHSIIIASVDAVLFLQLFDHLGLQPTVAFRPGGRSIALCASLLVNDFPQQQAAIAARLDRTELPNLSNKGITVAVSDLGRQLLI